MKRTLAQIRSAVAIEKSADRTFKGKDGGDKVKSFPTTIQTCGLLGALAYAVEKGHDSAEYKLSEACIAYLNKLIEDGYPVIPHISEVKDFARYLSGKDCTPTQFRRVNAEVMAFLNYLRRYASK